MKFRIKLTLTALAVLGLLAAACSQTPPVDHYPTFALAMDQLAGPGKWSAKSHSAGQDGLLTVSGLTIRLPGLKVPVAGAEETFRSTGSDGTAQDADNAVETTVTAEQVVEIATVEITKPLDKKTLEAIIAAPDWRNQKETKLADGIVLKGVSHKAPAPADLDCSIEEAAVKTVSLSAAGAEAPAGRAGFLKALRLGELSYKNLKTTSRSPEAELRFAAGSAVVKDVAFDGEMFVGLDNLDPSGLMAVMSAASAGSVSAKDLSLDVKDPGNQVSVRLTVASAEKKDVKVLRSLGELTMDGFKFDLVDEKGRPTTAGLARLHLRGLDMSAYMNRMMPVIIAAGLNPDQADKLAANMYTLGDLFVSPVSLDEASLSGLDINIAGMIGVKLAEAGGSGPYRAGQIPASHKSFIRGLEITLPEDGEKAAQDPDFKKFFEFGQKFGMTRFLIDSESEGSYEAESGRVVSRLNSLSVKDLLEFTGSGEMGGLTPERLEKLNSTPLAMITLALMAPEAVFGDVAFNNLNVRLEDKGLTDRVMGFVALETSEKGSVKLSAEDVRQQVLANLPQVVAMKGGEYLANPEALVTALTDFLKNPGSLELKMNADPPLGAKSFMTMGGDQNQILNSLNISLSANDQQAPALKFAISH